MNPCTLRAVSFAKFVFEHDCRSFCDAYVVALEMLNEEPKDQWTPHDVVETVNRAINTQKLAMLLESWSQERHSA